MKLNGLEKANLVTANTVLLRGTLCECLAKWITLPDGVRARVHVEFPTMTRGRYSLDMREPSRRHQELASDAA